jgi:hypothetical protein
MHVHGSYVGWHFRRSFQLCFIDEYRCFDFSGARARPSVRQRTTGGNECCVATLAKNVGDEPKLATNAGEHLSGRPTESTAETVGGWLASGMTTMACTAMETAKN